MSKIPLAPVPMYRTANNLDEAMSEIQAHTHPYDPNTIRSLVMLYHNSMFAQLEREGLLKYVPTNDA